MSEQTNDSQPKLTDFETLITELHGGVLVQKINRALSDVAIGVCYSDGKKAEGEVVLKMKIKQIGDSAQVAMTHTLSFTAPTQRGKKSESDSTDTPLHVGPRGRLTTYPEKQDDLFKERAGAKE